MRSSTEQRLRDLLEAAPDAIIEVDENGRILMLNGMTEKLFGYQREELVGQLVEVLIPEDLRAQHVHNRSNYCARPLTRHPRGIETRAAPSFFIGRAYTDVMGNQKSQSLGSPGDPVSAFLEAASVSREAHSSGTLDEVEELLARHPHIATSDIYVASALADETVVRGFLSRNRSPVLGGCLMSGIVGAPSLVRGACYAATFDRLLRCAMRVVRRLETLRLELRPLELDDARQAQVLFPHWDIVRRNIQSIRSL